MLKMRYLVLVAALLASGMTGCEAKKTVAQIHAEKEKAWAADKKQRAVKFYGILVQKYPDSPYATQAKQSLAALGPVGTPKPGTGALKH
jgi:hypothetical protein